MPFPLSNSSAIELSAQKHARFQDLSDTALNQAILTIWRQLQQTCSRRSARVATKPERQATHRCSIFRSNCRLLAKTRRRGDYAWWKHSGYIDWGNSSSWLPATIFSPLEQQQRPVNSTASLQRVFKFQIWKQRNMSAKDVSTMYMPGSLRPVRISLSDMFCHAIIWLDHRSSFPNFVTKWPSLYPSGELSIIVAIPLDQWLNKHSLRMPPQY